MTYRKPFLHPQNACVGRRAELQDLPRFCHTASTAHRTQVGQAPIEHCRAWGPVPELGFVCRKKLPNIFKRNLAQIALQVWTKTLQIGSYKASAERVTLGAVQLT